MATTQGHALYGVKFRETVLYNLERYIKDMTLIATFLCVHGIYKYVHQD